ncbi:MAG: S41 family peptidase [Clostridia bacterium]|nr:S41 family peptidase [Clostridia bacterium]
MFSINKKISLGTALGIAILAVTVSIAITMSVVNNSYNDVLKDLPEKIDRYSSLDEIAALVDSDFYGSMNKENVNSAIAKGFIDGLKDKYSVYMSADKYKTYLDESRGNMTGIGIEYSKRSDGYINVDRVYSDSPASSAGLKKDDLIVAFDGVSLNQDNYDEMSEKLTGDKLTSVNITFRHGTTEKTVNVVKGYEAKSVNFLSENSIGYISISNFYSTTATQVEDALNKLENKVKGIVVDLRDTSSTNIDEALKTLDLFIPMVEGANGIATLEDEKGNVIRTFTSTSGAVNIPLVIIVNSKTSGAAEFLACELRDFDKASIVGQKTRGNGLVQEIFPLTDGSAVKLSVGKIIPYRSTPYHGTGILPDKECETDSGKEIYEDPAYLCAAAFFDDTSE